MRRSFVLCLALLGCGSSVEPQAPTPRTGVVAQFLQDFLEPCAPTAEAPPRSAPLPPPPPVPPPPSEGMTGERDEVFVELTLLEVPTAVAAGTTLANLSDLAWAPDVTSVASPHLVADFGHAAKMETGGDPLGPAHVSLSSVSVLPQHADSGVTVLGLELSFRSPSGTKPYGLSVSGRADEPGLARLEIAPGRSVLLLFKLHPVHGEDDLRAIFQCKMQHAQRARARTN